MNEMNQSTAPENLLSNLSTGSTVAVTAPFVTDGEVLVGYALSPEESYCSAVPLNEFIALCPSLYQRASTPRIFHGLKRIWEYLDQRGLRTDTDPSRIDIDTTDDTKLLAYLLDPDSGRETELGEYRVQAGLTLSHLASRYLGEDYPYMNTDIYADSSPEVLAPALAHDARLIHRLAAALPGRMNKDLGDLYRDLELPLMLVLDNMRRVGIGVDGDACDQKRDRTGQEMARLADEITGGADVDLRSDRDLYRFLAAQGVQFLDPSVHQWRKVSNFILEQTAPHYPWVQKILDYRGVSQDLSFLQLAAGRDRVHPVWGQTRSATSRIYARNPAVQNVSRDLRHLFVAPLGHVLIKADYSQAQMRILAHLSRDPELMRIFRDPNGDVHTETSDWLGLTDRSVAKEINFAICFGMGPSALCRKINELKESLGVGDIIDEAAARSYIEGFYERFSKVRAFFDREWEMLKKLPAHARVVQSLMGRERRFPRRASSEMERQFRVTWTQQIEADLIKTAMLRFDRIFRRRNMKARIVMMIHDALWVEAPPQEAEQVRHLMTRMMTTTGKLGVPLEVDIE